MRQRRSAGAPPSHNLEACGVPYADNFVTQSAGIFGSHTAYDILGEMIGYRPPNWPSEELGKSWLPIFAGKLDPGRVGSSSATDLPMLSFTGVARKAWTLPSSGPLRTVAMPEICPRSLILLAVVHERLEPIGNSVLRSVITSS